MQLLVRTDCKSRALKNGADTRIYNSNWDFWMLGRLSLRLICSRRRFASIQSGRVCSNFSKCIATCVPTCPFQVFANGMNLFYERAGSSKNAVLCLTGALGTTRAHFDAQLKSAALTSNHSVVVFDLRGYGQSRPPARSFSGDFNHRDARDGLAVMRSLGFDQFSVLGFSAGANIAVIMAANEPEVIKKMVIWGGTPFITEEDVKRSVPIRNVDFWSEGQLEAMEAVYGPDGLRELWGSWSNATDKIYSQGGNVCKAEVGMVRCPTFLLHGGKDPLVPRLHVDYLLENLKCPLLYHEFPNGKHNIHLKHADEFNKLIADFLSE